MLANPTMRVFTTFLATIQISWLKFFSNHVFDEFTLIMKIKRDFNPFLHVLSTLLFFSSGHCVGIIFGYFSFSFALDSGRNKKVVIKTPNYPYILRIPPFQRLGRAAYEIY